MQPAQSLLDRLVEQLVILGCSPSSSRRPVRCSAFDESSTARDVLLWCPGIKPEAWARRTRHCQIIPPFLLEKVVSPEALQRDTDLRRKRAQTAPTPSGPAAAGAAPFVVNTANNGTDLPGELVRSAGDPASGDPGRQRGLRRRRGAPSRCSRRSTTARPTTARAPQVVTTVHYDQDYDNAFWDGQQLVIGDGDGTVFERFTVAARRARPRADPRRHPSTPPTSPTRASPARSTSRSPTCSAPFLKQRLAGGDREQGRLADRRGHLQARHPGHRAASR